MSESALRAYYKCSGDTIRRWAKISGVTPIKVRKPAERDAVFYQYDTPEQIKMCLSCTQPVCMGTCEKIRTL